eukprot:NODE_313_length_10011_cov_0.634584.p5 type:complete len:289 gc:universal NODE_313_length_10011_cov_0.634584:2994-3860(+)
MNGIELPTHDIERLVKISASTINKRLLEFSSTESASLSGNTFQVELVSKEEEPPSFKKNRDVEKNEKMVSELNITQQKKLMEIIVNELDDDDFAEEIQLSIDDMVSLEYDSVSLNAPTAATDEGKNLSDLEDDPVVNEMILSKEAAEIKKMIWHKEYEEDLKEMAARNKRPPQATRKKKPKENFKSVSEAIKKKVAPKLSKKLNYELMQVLDTSDARTRTTLPPLDPTADENKSIITLSSYKTNKTGFTQATHLTRASLFSTRSSQFKFQRLKVSYAPDDFNAYDEYD